MKLFVFLSLYIAAIIKLQAQTVPVFPAKTKANEPAQSKNTKATSVKKIDPKSVKSTASLKIMCDVDAKVYVDGEYKSDVKPGIAYKLPLDKGIYQIKIVSARFNNVVQIRDGYKIENSDQQDYWNVNLGTIERASRADQLVRILKDCMPDYYSGPTQGKYSISTKQALSVSDATITFARNAQLFDDEKKLFGNMTEMNVIIGASITGFEIKKDLNSELKKNTFNTTQAVILLGKGRFIFTDQFYPENNSDKASGEVLIYIRDYCADELEKKLKAFFDMQ